MIRMEDCEFVQLRSVDDETAFFAQMGRFFASAAVRRDCGGYPLSDGPRHRWFIVRHKRQARVMGFISVEHQDGLVRIRDGYLRVEARKLGLFRELRRQVLDYVDGLGLPCSLRVQISSAALLAPHGFQTQSTRGNWVTMKRSAYAACSGTAEEDGSPVLRTG